MLIRSSLRSEVLASSAKQSWGFWTQSKLQILEEYLPRFLTACSGKVVGAVYLDAFAGEGAGRDRLTNHEFDGSARIAASAVADNGSGLQFTCLRFVELDRGRAEEITAEFRRDFPDRDDIAVKAGDCNVEIPKLLAAMPPEMTWRPTFAFLDPFGIELRWETINALADYKRHTRYKVEMFMLFATPAIMRIAGLSEDKAVAGADVRLTGLFGSSDWELIVEARRATRIGGEQAREAFLNLMRWRLVHDLGYRSTHVLEFKNAGGVPIYHMVFCTDNDAGDRIMAHLYGAAATRNQDMAEDARIHKTGIPTLFRISETSPPKYKPTPPVDPAEYLRALVAAPDRSA